MKKYKLVARVNCPRKGKKGWMARKECFKDAAEMIIKKVER